MKVPATAHTERQGIALSQLAFEEAGFLFREQNVHDYGIDAHVEIVQNGRPTGRLLGVQVKSGSSFFSEKINGEFVYRSDDDHIQYWLHHSLPIILTLCDFDTRQVYWQALSGDTVISTGKGWKVTVPQSQTIDPTEAGKLAELASRIVPEAKYTVLKQQDISVGIAKRYSLKILLNHNLSKPEIAAVIRQVVSRYAGSQYHPNKWAAEKWKGKNASIITVFVYLTPDDEQDCNYFCRSIWVDKDYPDESPRPSWEGENVGSNIITEWSSLYQALAGIHRSYAVSKEDYLDNMQAILEALLPIMTTITASLSEELSDSARDATPTLKAASKAIEALEKRAEDIGRPPTECGEVHLKFRSLITYASNIVMPFLIKKPNPERNRYVEQYCVEDFYKTLPEFYYELKKVT